jgi:hypothetical protein
LHLVWLLGFMFFSGVVNLWLIWGRRPVEARNLWIAAAWQSCNLGGFWVAYALVDAYGGVVTVPGEHVHILGWDENVFVFMILSIITFQLCARFSDLTAALPPDGHSRAKAPSPEP